MNIVSTLKAWRECRFQSSGLQWGFVATMGNLHDGHLALCERSLNENDKTVVSIFVNPTQFNQADDFNAYPRTLEEDRQKLTAIGVDVLLTPSPEELYADAYSMQVNETTLSRVLEGEHRPGHFTGMLTIVMKLFNWVQAHHAYFGEKDYQQYLLVKKMVEALFMPVHVIPCETLRAQDGLALSSRNARLSEQARLLAPAFPRLLQSNKTPEEITQALVALGFKVDYIAEQWGRRLGAVWLDNVRLIDNVRL